MKFMVSDQMVREATWDGFDHARVPALLTALGLPGESDDVRDMEHAASHARCERLLHLAVPLATLSDTMGSLQAGFVLAQAEEAGLAIDDLDSERLSDAYSQLIASSVVAILSQLIAAGHLEAPNKYGYR